VRVDEKICVLNGLAALVRTGVASAHRECARVASRGSGRPRVGRNVEHRAAVGDPGQSARSRGLARHARARGVDSSGRDIGSARGPYLAQSRDVDLAGGDRVLAQAVTRQRRLLDQRIAAHQVGGGRRRAAHCDHQRDNRDDLRGRRAVTKYPSYVRGRHPPYRQLAK